MPERGAPQWEGSRRPEPGTKRTMQDIFQKLDKLVTPGVGQASTSSQTADAQGSRKRKRGSKGPPCETFAAAACGTSGQGGSGFQRITDARKKAKVAGEYDSYQQYRCSICRKNAGSKLAIRPPSETMRLYKAGPRARILPGCQDSDVFAVYEDEHSQCFEAAGYVPIQVKHFQPGMPLPIDLFPPVASETTASSQGPVQNRTGSLSTTGAERNVMEILTMPPDVPNWHDQPQKLFDIVEKPFHTENGEGPFTPAYLWPNKRGTRLEFGDAWKQGRAIDSLKYIYQDYYNLKIRPRGEIHDNMPESHLKMQILAMFDLSWGTDTLPKGTLSALRRLPKPPSAKTWREAVVAKFSQTPGYQDPNKFNK